MSEGTGIRPAGPENLYHSNNIKFDLSQFRVLEGVRWFSPLPKQSAQGRVYNSRKQQRSIKKCK